MLDEQRLHRIAEVGRTVVSELDLEALLQRVLEEARALTDARYAALGILDDDRTELERFLTLGIDADTHRAIGDLPHGRGVLGVLINEPRPLRLSNVSDHPRSYGFPLDHPPMRTFLGVPILVRGEVFGNLYLAEKAGGAEFDADDEETIVLLAGWASIAIANARAYHGESGRRRELEQAVRGLEATTAIARAVGGETDLDRVLELIVKRARALVDARSVLIQLQNGGENLHVVAVAGQLGDEVLDLRTPIDNSISGHVMRTQRVERLANVRQHLRFALAPYVDATTGMFVPLIFRGRSLGVLCAFDRGDGAEFAREHERLLESFAASAATAVATAQTVASEGLRRSIEASERERQRWARELHDETLQELAGLKVLLSGARRSADVSAIHATLDQALEQIGTEIAGLRRLITDLRPAALDAFGVEPALEALSERIAATSGLEVGLEIDLAYESGRRDERLPRPVEDALYRLVQEALTNVVKHAGARRVAIALVERDDGIDVAIEDDGRGFDPRAASDGFGLVGMRERAALLGGKLTVASSPGEGTQVLASLPLGDDARAEHAARSA